MDGGLAQFVQHAGRKRSAAKIGVQDDPVALITGCNVRERMRSTSRADDVFQIGRDHRDH